MKETKKTIFYVYYTDKHNENETEICSDILIEDDLTITRLKSFLRDYCFAHEIDYSQLAVGKLDLDSSLKAFYIDEYLTFRWYDLLECPFWLIAKLYKSEKKNVLLENLVAAGVDSDVINILDINNLFLEFWHIVKTKITFDQFTNQDKKNDLKALNTVESNTYIYNNEYVLSSDQEIDCGPCFGGVNYYKNEKYYTIKMNFSFQFTQNRSNSISIKSYKGSKQAVVVPPYILGYSVINIARNAFSNSDFQYLDLPYTLETIENSAFTNTNLYWVVIPKTVTYIGDHAFAKSKLVSVNLESSKTTLGYNVFSENPIKHFIIENTRTWFPEELSTSGRKIVQLASLTQLSNDMYLIEPYDNNVVQHLSDEEVFNITFNQVQLNYLQNFLQNIDVEQEVLNYKSSSLFKRYFDILIGSEYSELYEIFNDVNERKNIRENYKLATEIISLLKIYPYNTCISKLATI